MPGYRHRPSRPTRHQVLLPHLLPARRRVSRRHGGITQQQDGGSDACADRGHGCAASDVWPLPPADDGARDRHGQRQVDGALRRCDRRLVRGAGRNVQQRNDQRVPGQLPGRRGGQISGAGMEQVQHRHRGQRLALTASMGKGDRTRRRLTRRCCRVSPHPPFAWSLPRPHRRRSAGPRRTVPRSGPAPPQGPAESGPLIPAPPPPPDRPMPLPRFGQRQPPACTPQSVPAWA